MALHQCERLCNNPGLVHKHTIRCIGTYLTSTSTHVDLPYVNQHLYTHGMVYNTYKKGIESYVDSNFADGWAQADFDNAENFMWCTGYVITYAGFPVLWCSKLQT